MGTLAQPKIRAFRQRAKILAVSVFFFCFVVGGKPYQPDLADEGVAGDI
jgi:hypothetical protein